MGTMEMPLFFHVLAALKAAMAALRLGMSEVRDRRAQMSGMLYCLMGPPCTSALCDASMRLLVRSSCASRPARFDLRGFRGGFSGPVPPAVAHRAL